MHIALIVIAILIIAGGKVYQRQTEVKVIKETEPTLTSTILPTVDLTPIASATPTLTNTSKPIITNNPTIKPTLSISNEWWIYPDNLRIDNKDNRVQIWTKIAAGTVADWYEDKLKSQNANNKTIVRTSTNGKVKIVISAFAGGTKYDINIDQQNKNSETTIIVALSIDRD